MNRTLAGLLVLALLGCTSKKPSIERDPGRYTPAETDARKVTRLEERIHTVQERVNAWIRELEMNRASAVDATKLQGATERLHGAATELERVRVHANDVKERASDSEDLEREVLRIEAVAERAYRDGLDALGRHEPIK